MRLETRAGGYGGGVEPYSFSMVQREGEEGLWRIDFREMIKEWLVEADGERLARRFHRTLLEMIRAMVRLSEEEMIVLTGGCFQNRVLLEGAIEVVREEGRVPFWHRVIPPNDGGIAAGQLWAAAWREDG